MSLPSHGACQSPSPALRILHLEDNPADAELIQSMLEAGGIASTIQRVETPADFESALDQGCFDLIISDHTLPGFDGLSALGLAREKHPTLAGCYPEYYKNIYGAITGKEELAVKPEQAREIIRLIELAGQSAREKRWVPVN